MPAIFYKCMPANFYKWMPANSYNDHFEEYLESKLNSKELKPSR